MHIRKIYRFRSFSSMVCLVSFLWLGMFSASAQTEALSPATPGGTTAQAGMPAVAGTEPSWLSFERGKRLYVSKDFGNALLAFDNAIEYRRVAFARAKERLLVVLETKTAKKIEGKLSALLDAFATEDFLASEYKKMLKSTNGMLRPLIKLLKTERISESHRAFLEVLELVLQYRPLESLSDSLGALKNSVEELSLYPEAEYWKGRVFLIEGELAITIQQYLRAFEMRGSLEIPEDRYMILYSLAEIYATSKDYLAWENTMKRILMDDKLAGEPAIDPFLRDAMLATLSSAGLDRFMTLYRMQPSFSLKANFEIAAYYLERGRARAPVHAAIAVNMILTRAIAIFAAKEWDFSWAGLVDFLERAKTREDVAAYLEDTHLVPLLMTLADSLYVANSRQSAMAIWQAVSGGSAIPWSASAKKRLANPATALTRIP